MPDPVSRIAPHVGAILDRLAEAVTVQDADGRLVYANAAAARLLGFDRSEELLSAAPGHFLELYDVLDEHGRPLDLARLPGRRVFAGEEPEPVIVQYVDRRTGDRRFSLTKASVLEDAEGAPLYAVNVIEDVTALLRAQLEQSLMARASHALAASLDPRRTVERIAWALVPEIADRATVLVPAEGGRLETAAVADADAERATARTAPDLETLSALPGAVLESPRRIVAPVVASGETLAVITLSTEPSGRRLDERDVAVADELGHRAGTALENARRHESRARIASTLQRSLLPPKLPDIPGLALAARFRSAEEGTEVGGDFYDVFPVDGAWFAVMGDVTGKGPAAAAVTGLARYTLRTAALYETSPSAALDRLNTTLLGEQRQCSAVCARLVPVAAGWDVSVGSAGHPLPFVLRRGEEPVALGRPGTLGGAFREGRASDEATMLRTGDTLLFYTDGVTDARGPVGRFETEGLVGLLERLDDTGAEHVVATIDAALREFQPGPQRDDIALLALEVL